jgi:hypothetical protein
MTVMFKHGIILRFCLIYTCTHSYTQRWHKSFPSKYIIIEVPDSQPFRTQSPLILKLILQPLLPTLESTFIFTRSPTLIPLQHHKPSGNKYNSGDQSGLGVQHGSCALGGGSGRSRGGSGGGRCCSCFGAYTDHS